jgi:mono/diheme cytochrome c family protein
MEKPWKYVLLGAGATVVLGAIGMVAFLYSGIYPIAANEPHSVPVTWVLHTLQQNAVGLHSDDDRPVPELADADLLADGLALYHENCAVCHGAPGVERAILGRGLNPDPPRLATEIREWSDVELFWIVANGLKMAGMPAFKPGLSDREVWATVAFMRALPQVTPAEYRRAAGSSTDLVADLMRRRLEAHSADPGFETDVEKGRLLVESYGCGSCHIIPGVGTSRGQVGPPLDKFGLRHYIAGAVLNNPENLTRWLVAPESIEPGTAMPSVGATPEDAAHMAAYLLSLGADESLIGPKGIFPAAWLPKH